MKSSIRNKIIRLFTILVFLLRGGVLLAEGSFYDEVAGKEVQQAASGNAGADKIASGMTADANNVNDYTKTNSSQGREQKAADGATTAGIGKGIAIGTGAALMARGVPMLASPFPSVVATGAALIAKAGLEFAQAAVDNGSQKANSAQEKLLRAEAGQNGESVAAANAAGKKEVTDKVAEIVGSNAELAKVLGDKGVNPEDFAKRLASGELNSPESVLAASGSAAGVDATALAQGVQASKSPGQLPDLSSSRAIQEDSIKDQKGSEEKDSGTASAGNSKSNGASAAGSHGASPGTDGPVTTANLVQALTGAGSRGAAAASELLKNASEGDLANMLAGFMGMGASADKDVAVGGKLSLDRAELEKKGILKSSGKATIFALAHRNYRSFKKWRKKSEVVAAR